MSSPSQPAAISVTMTTTTAHDSSAPRKRRRRAPATGAADDCFTCRKKQIKCDRRRPYCSQCLEQNKDCSGYKTQLTWGVGVASRGKLRGLSTPVAKQPSSSSSTSSSSSSSSASKVDHARSRSSASSRSGGSSSAATRRASPPTKISLADSKQPLITSYDFVNMDPAGSSVVNSPEPDWPPSPTIQDYVDGQNYCHGLYRQSLQWLGASMGSPMDDMSVSASTSTGSVSGWSDSDYASPIDYPQTPDEISYVPAPLPPYSHAMYASPSIGVNASPTCSTGGMMYDRRGPTSCPDQQLARSSVSSDQSRYDFLEGNQIQQRPMGQFNLAEVFYDDDMSGTYMTR
ncbi:hypothetical protein GP486_008557 [Trichoglossum hirsutum]|uniref:Zn(2)-C6 fungal-type domain-containing protein n=1 Tax=Trichoglossum hirsutum TaxID=265104 RepID=A0A9P8I5J5_9PEZI|nr:hypothetical protein GP486_008557 [Trichoglossum hirsutum]